MAKFVNIVFHEKDNYTYELNLELRDISRAIAILNKELAERISKKVYDKFIVSSDHYLKYLDQLDKMEEQ